MKRNIISAIIGCLIGSVVGIIAIHQQPIQREKETATIRQYSVSYVKETEEETFDAEAYWKYEEQKQEEETQRILRMREADMELMEMGVEIPTQVVEYCEDAGEVYNICPEFLEAICWVESRCTYDATNGSCKGIMQISERWHYERMERLGVASIYDEKGNIMVGADYLAELFEEYEDPVICLMTYNGDSRVDDFAEGKAGMSDYANSVLTIAKLLEKANGK